MKPPEQTEWAHPAPNLWQTTIDGVPCYVEHGSTWTYRVGVPGFHGGAAGRASCLEEGQGRCRSWVRR